MPDHVILQKVLLGEQHQPTGRTRHYSQEGVISSPSSLIIIKYPDDTGYYLLYLNNEDQEIADTYHETITGALEQAEFEFKVKPEEWTILPEF